MIRPLLAEAEVLAWPFWDPGALGVPDPALPDGAPVGLRARLDRHHEVGDPELLRDAIWGDAPNVFALLRHHADRLLEPDGAVARLRADPELPGREILRWRAVSLLLPPTLLLGALGLSYCSDPYLPPGARRPQRVRVLDPTLRPAGPTAHLHLHLGATCSFSALWSALAAVHALGGMTDKVLDAAEGDLPPAWTDIVRDALAFRHAFTHGHDLEPWRSADHARAAVRGPHAAADRKSRLALRALRQARSAALPRPDALPTRVDLDVWEQDPDGDRLPHPEPDILARMLRAVDDAPTLRVPVLRYLRTQTRLYRHLVMDPTTRGLSRFVTTYNRIGPYADLTDHLLRAPGAYLADEQGDLDVRAAEFRTRPPKSAAELDPLCDRLNKLPIEAALVVHFIRSGGDGAWESVYARSRAATDILVRSLRAQPHLLQTVRALDVAADETRGPLWLLIPALREVRAESQRIASAHQGCPLSPLRLTLHVGEDFEHLLTGLRAVAEPYLWGLLRRGDRLGHALALGLDPERWVAWRPQTRTRVWERVLDLGWALGVVERNSLEVPASCLDGLRRELRERLAWTDLRAEQVWDLITRLGQSDLLPGLVPRGSPAPGIDAAIAGRLRSQSERARRAGHRDPHGDVSSPIPSPWDAVASVATARDLPALTAISDWLGRLVAYHQTAVELNPTSNLVIGGFSQLVSQPGFALRADHDRSARAVPTTISADDPLSFATCLPDELGYAWAGLVHAAPGSCAEGGQPGRGSAVGATPGSARAWIDHAAATAWRARFSEPRPVSR